MNMWYQYVVSWYDGYAGTRREQKFENFKDARGLATALKNNPNFRDVTFMQITKRIQVIPEREWYYDNVESEVH